MSELDYTDAAAQEPEVEVNPLAGLVDAAIAKDYNKANQIFGQAVSVKLGDVMDQERIKIAGQIFNGDDDDEEDLQAGGIDDEAEGESESDEETDSEESEAASDEAEVEN